MGCGMSIATTTALRNAVPMPKKTTANKDAAKNPVDRFVPFTSRWIRWPKAFYLWSASYKVALCNVIVSAFVGLHFGYAWSVCYLSASVLAVEMLMPNHAVAARIYKFISNVELFLRVMRSPKLKPEQARQNLDKCHGCERARYYLPKSPPYTIGLIPIHCSQCSCPRTYFSDLRIATMYQGYVCIENKFKHKPAWLVLNKADKKLLIEKRNIDREAEANKHENENDHRDTRSVTVGASAMEQVREKGCCRGGS